MKLFREFDFFEEYEKNISVKMYVGLTVLLLIYTMLVYLKNLQLVTIPELEMFFGQIDSVNLFVELHIFLTAFLTIITLPVRNVIGIISNVFMPLLIWLSLVVAQYSMTLFKITYILCGVAVVVYLIMAVIAFIKKKILLVSVIANAVYHLKYLIFAILFIIMIPSYIYFYEKDIDDALYRVESEFEEAKNAEIERKANNQEYNGEFEKFSKWNDLNYEERLVLLDKFLEHQCLANEMPTVKLYYKKISNMKDFAENNNEDNKIYVELNDIMNNSAENCMKDVLYKFRAYCQEMTCEVMEEIQKSGIDYSKAGYFKQAEKWLEAKKSNSNQQSYKEHYMDVLETDKRDYVEAEFEKYKEYLGK